MGMHVKVLLFKNITELEKKVNSKNVVMLNNTKKIKQDEKNKTTK